MRTWRAVFLIFGLVLLIGSRGLAQRGSSRGGNASATGERAWLHSLDEGLAEAAETGKPLMVVIRCQP